MKKYLLLLFLGVTLSFYGHSQGLTNVGTDFWIAFPPNPGAANLQIFISSNFTTSGNISSAFPGVNQAFTVVPGVLTQITIPVGVTLAGGIENKGIRVTALNPVSVYGLNPASGTTDAYLALPVSSLGTDYRVMTYKTTLATSGSCFSVVAIQNGTVLTIFNHQTGGTSNINLNEGNTYHLEAGALNEDLTGSRIQSNFPVAVFGSVDMVDIPDISCTYADHIVEQMLPLSAWGKDYVTVPTAGRDGSGDIFRILAAEDGTVVSINGVVVSTLSAGSFYQSNLNGYNSITATKAVLVAQFAKGHSCTGNNTGDPFMMLIFPREQFLTNYTIGAVAGFTSHWVNVVAPSYALGTILQDGLLIPTAAFTAISTTGFYGAQRSVSDGTHTFSSAFPFGVFVYGWTTANSYGYPGGGSLSPVATVTNVTISPATANGVLNVTLVCFTAHVTDNNGNPVEGILVNFKISGINPLTGNAYTNASGDAEYCYTQTGIVPGTDYVYAEVFGFTSTTSTVNWTYTSPCVNPTDGGMIGNSQEVCSGSAPSQLVNILLPTGYTGTIEYKWQLSTTGSGSGFTDIAGSNAAFYAPGALTVNTWFKRLARVDCMSGWADAVESNVIAITVEPRPGGVMIKHN